MAQTLTANDVGDVTLRVHSLEQRISAAHREENLLKTTIDDFAHFGRGLLMGSADIVPGVSGGTVALIVGIYERLITAISQFDAELVRLALDRDWRAAAARVDLRFLAALGAGIATALVTLANLMSYLLVHQRSPTLAAFFGLILASTVIVARMIKGEGPQRLTCLLAGAAGVAFAYWLVGRDVADATGAAAADAVDNLVYFFLCGMVAICAMILPGISGAFILLILGAYEPIVAIIKDLTRLESTRDHLTTLIVFAAGCAIGLIAFSKLVRWLLANAHDVTMAVLCGFMLGSLRRIWPFQRDLTPEIERLSLKRYENFTPESWTGEVTTCLVIGSAALVFVLTVEWWAGKSEKRDR